MDTSTAEVLAWTCADVEVCLNMRSCGHIGAERAWLQRSADVVTCRSQERSHIHIILGCHQGPELDPEVV